MLDSIFIAMSALTGHQRGLSVISNNVANMNTTGFKGSSVEFSDVFTGDRSGGGDPPVSEGGLNASRVALDLRAGESKQTGRDLDLALVGDGFFLVRDASGATHYTRDGATEFDGEGVLVGRTSRMTMLARAASGTLEPIKLDGLRNNPPKATTEINFSGNLSTTGTVHAIDAITVFDKAGGLHSLHLDLTNTSATAPGSWHISLKESGQEIAIADVHFDGGRASEASARVKLSAALAGTEAQDLTMVFGDDVTAFSSGTTSTLALKSQDGHAAGTVSALKFDEGGVLKVAYSNGETADGPTLALAQFRNDSGLRTVGQSLFVNDGAEPALIRVASDDLRVTSQTLEASNVDLTQEFSELILMQRGYQASSQVISTANDMLQELFDMKGRR